MTPFAEVVAKWESVSNIPVFVGAAPEKTPLPYVVLNAVQSNPVILSPRVLAWTESLLQFNVCATKLEESEQVAQVAKNAFLFFRGSIIADMVLMNDSPDYSKQPNLSGNRGWVTTMEYRIRY